jgi:tetratricopeptide (TPR) repeat protein
MSHRDSDRDAIARRRRRALALALHAVVTCGAVRADDRADGLAALSEGRHSAAYSLLAPVYRAAPDDRRLAVSTFNAAMGVFRESIGAGRNEEARAAADFAASIDAGVVGRDAHGSALYCRAQAHVALGQTDPAIASLEEARSYSNNPLVYQALAGAHFRKQSWSQAAAYMRDYMDSGGKMTPNDYQLLAAALDRTGASDQALHWTRMAQADFPEETKLAEMRSKLSREVQTERGMQQTYNDHFQIKFQDVPEQEEMRSRIIVALRDARASVGRSFGTYLENTVQVVLYPSKVSYSAGGGAPQWSLAHYDGKLRIPVTAAAASTEALQRVARHEYTHFLLDQITMSNCPAWLNEGLAQIEEGADREGAAATVRRHAQRGPAALLDLARLEASFASVVPGAEQAELAYAEAYLATRYLLDTHGRSVVTDILDDLARRKPLGDSLRERTSADYETFQKQWLARASSGGR